MTTIRVKLRLSSVTGKAGSIYYQIIHQREHVQLTSSVKLHPREWDARNGRVCIQREKSSRLLEAQRMINADLALLHDIISRKMATGIPYRTADIAYAFRMFITKEIDFFSYIAKRICQLEKKKAYGTSRNYLRAYRSFSSFLKKQCLPFAICTPELIQEYEQWLLQRGIKRNSSSFYMRVLRAVYNSAAGDGLAPSGNPFKKVYTGVDVSRKRAVDKEVIVQLKKLDLTEEPVLDYTRDLFLFCLYSRGMAFVDMAYLQKDEVKYGVMVYIRKKTGIRLCIKIEPCLQEIIVSSQSKINEDKEETLDNNLNDDENLK